MEKTCTGTWPQDGDMLLYCSDCQTEVQATPGVLGSIGGTQK